MNFDEQLQITAREQYVSAGVPLHRISDTMHIPFSDLQLWSKEHNWATERDNHLKEVLVGYKSKTIELIMAEQERGRTEFKELYEKALQLLGTTDATDIDDLEKYIKLLDKIYILGDKLYGFEVTKKALDITLNGIQQSSASGPQNNINILNGMVDASKIRARENSILVKDLE